MTKALLIKTTGEVEVTTIPDENGHLVLNELCGGWLDCVRTDDLVGYVNDEGLLIGLDPNALASLIFGRPLVGNCVVVGALNEHGVYDGENHDVPAPYLSPVLGELAQALVNDESVMESLRGAIEDIDLVPKVSTLTDEEFQAWLDGEFDGYKEV